MTALYITLHTLGLRLQDRLDAAHDTLRHARHDRGSVSVEAVLWAVAAIAFAGIVITAITAYVTKKSQLLK